MAIQVLSSPTNHTGPQGSQLKDPTSQQPRTCVRFCLVTAMQVPKQGMPWLFISNLTSEGMYDLSSYTREQAPKPIHKRLTSLHLLLVPTTSTSPSPQVPAPHLDHGVKNVNFQQ